jgi:biotin carboxyl carrier protein
VLVTVAAPSLAGVSDTPQEIPVDEHEVLSFAAPMSGRFYRRPSPAEPPFVAEGDVVERGRTIGLLEVMKTFNRLVYQGEAMPERAVVERIVPDDGDDVARGDVILVLGPTVER